jgi:rod shape determining protein RodA
MTQRRKIDFWLLGPVFILISLSLATLFTINIGYFRTQFISLIVAIFGYIFFSRINIEFLRQLKIPIYFISIILLILVLVLGIEARGASRWVEILGVRLQFSEILKPFLCISFASIIADYKEINFKSFLKIFILLFPIVLLITIQPDLGSGLLYAAVALLVLLVIGYPLVWFVAISLPFIFASPIIWNMLHEYQRQRVLTFINSTNDPLGTSYNSIQAIIAVGSGSLLGKGISEGTQSVLKFLPERHTDFIFATIAEGLGFVGAGFLIIAFMLLIFRIFIIFNQSDNLFSKAFLACVFGFFLIQGFVNIAMNLGLLPIVGITLPFVSFGGSSLLSNFIFLGMISSLSSIQADRQVLEIK